MSLQPLVCVIVKLTFIKGLNLVVSGVSDIFMKVN